MIYGLDAGLVDRVAGLLFLLIVFHFLKPERVEPKKLEGKNLAQKHVKTDGKNRSVFFDFAKGLAMIIVVAIHTDDVVPRGSILERIVWFALPVFIMASGYLLMRGYSNEFEVKRFISSTFWRLIVPYVIYTIFAGIFIDPRANPAQILSDIFWGSQNGGTLFFIPLLLQLYALFAVLAYWPTLRRIALHPITLLLVFLLAYSISDADHALRSARWNTPADSLIFAGRYLFYFLMGMWLSRFGFGKNNLRGIGIILLAGIPLWLLAYDPDGWDQPFAYPIWAFLALWAVYRFVSEKGWAKLPIGLIASIGRYSLMIYMIHQIVIYDLLWPLQNVIPLSGWMRADLIVLAAVAISLVVGKLLMDAYSRICIWGQALILPR